MIEDRWYLFRIDEFGHTTVLTNGTWDTSPLVWPGVGGMAYAIRSLHTPGTQAVLVKERGRLHHHGDDGVVETWDGEMKEWLMVGFNIGPKGYWYQSNEQRRISFYDDFAGGDDDEEFAGAE